MNPYALPRNYLRGWMVAHAPRSHVHAVEDLCDEVDALRREVARLTRERDRLAAVVEAIGAEAND